MTFVQMTKTLKEVLVSQGGERHVDVYGHRIGKILRDVASDCVEVKWIGKDIAYVYQTSDLEEVVPDYQGHFREPFSVDEFDGVVCRVCDQWFERGNYCLGTI